MTKQHGTQVVLENSIIRHTGMRQGREIIICFMLVNCNTFPVISCWQTIWVNANSRMTETEMAGGLCIPWAIPGPWLLRETFEALILNRSYTGWLPFFGSQIEMNATYNYYNPYWYKWPEYFLLPLRKEDTVLQQVLESIDFVFYSDT